MANLLIILVAFLFATYTSIWRVWFGGGYPQWIKDNIKPAIRRFVMNIVNIAMMFVVCYFVREIEWYWSIYVALVMQLIYWNYTFGMYMDIGRDKDYLTPEDIEEYNKPWFAPILNWIFKSEEYYSRLYDFFGMMIRFTFPLILIFWVGNFNFGLCMLGILVPVIYELDRVLVDKHIENKHWILCNFNEFGSGFATGLLLILIGML